MLPSRTLGSPNSTARSVFRDMPARVARMLAEIRRPQPREADIFAERRQQARSLGQRRMCCSAHNAHYQDQ